MKKKRKKMRYKPGGQNRKGRSKIVEINPNSSIITINVNRLFQFKDTWYSNCDF